MILKALLACDLAVPRRAFSVSSLHFPSRRVCFSFQDSIRAFLGHPDLPFSDVLDAETIRSVFAKHRCSFGDIYKTAIVLWAFLNQILSDAKQASCQSAVAKISAYYTRHGMQAPHANTGDYCRARAKLPEAALKELGLLMGRKAQDHVEVPKRWYGRNVYIIDGFTFQMPDTEKNQKQYPQHTAQKPGLGFPIARVVTLVSLATGCVVEAALGPYQGKDTGEAALFRSFLDFLKPGDVVVADRHYCSYAMIRMLMERGIHVCFRNHQSKKSDFRKGKRLGKNDHCVTWSRGPRPAWMTQEQYEQLPKSITLREVRYVIEKPGRKQSPYVIITTILETKGEKGASYGDLQDLYGFRWNIELDIRTIKSYLNVGFLRCKSPGMIRREFWCSLLGYNLIRTTIAIAATLYRKSVRHISFTSACQFVLAGWGDLATCRSQTSLLAYCRQLLKRISQCKVGDRPGRFEPRVVKRRRDQYTLMMLPRNDLRRRLKRGDNTFE
jgi:putative transposase